MLDFDINHYHLKLFDVRLQSVFSAAGSGLCSALLPEGRPRLRGVTVPRCNRTAVLCKRTRLTVTSEAFTSEYSGSQAIKLIVVNTAVSVPLIWALGIMGKLVNGHISY